MCVRLREFVLDPSSTSSQALIGVIPRAFLPYISGHKYNKRACRSLDSSTSGVLATRDEEIAYLIQFVDSRFNSS